MIEHFPKNDRGEMVDLPEIKSSMLDKLAESNAFFKSQQRGEPDLTQKDKRHIADEVLSKNPGLFLYRYGKYLDEDDMKYFTQFRDDYEVEHHLQELGKNFNAEKHKVTVKNRRYEALRRLVQEGSYFSDSEMRRRNPLLFEQMVGRYLTDEEKEELDSTEDTEVKLSTILMEHMDRDEISSLRNKQQKEEEAQFEESDSDEDTPEESASGENPIIQDIPEEEKLLFREEFVASMRESFLMGKDEDFDYSEVDDNEEYDIVDDQKEEDKYFDSEVPELSEEPMCEDKDVS